MYFLIFLVSWSGCFGSWTFAEAGELGVNTPGALDLCAQLLLYSQGVGTLTVGFYTNLLGNFHSWKQRIKETFFK